MKSFPINCTVNKLKSAKLAKVALDDYHKPVVFLWCKKCRTEHKCSLTQLLQSWRDMAKGNQQAIVQQQDLLKTALAHLQEDLEDIQQQEAAG